jgi:hypothetical protein
MTDEQKEIVKAAKGETWYDGWKPYCLVCSSIVRMEEREYGFQCGYCLNKINWDLTPIVIHPKIVV